MPLSGIALSNIDSSVRPQDDLYQHVNGTWLKSTEIPDDRPLEGTFTALRDGSELAVKEIIEDAAARGAESTGIEQKIGDLYNSFMDEAAVEAKGLDPIRQRLAEVFATESAADLVALAGRLFRADVGGLFYIYPAPDAGNPDRILLYTGQGGLGLPDESYYREEKFAPMVQAYQEHVKTVFGLAGVADPAGGGRPGGGAGDRAGLAPLGQSHPARPAEDVQPEVRGRGGAALPAPHDLVRRRRHRAGEARRPGGEHPGLLRRCGVAAGLRAAVRLAGVAGHARRQRGRAVPVRRVRRCQLRLLRHHAQRHAAQQGPVEARGRRRRGRAGRGRRPDLRGPALPGDPQGPHGVAGREPDRGLPRIHHRPCLDGRGHQA